MSYSRTTSPSILVSKHLDTLQTFLHPTPFVLPCPCYRTLLPNTSQFQTLNLIFVLVASSGRPSSKHRLAPPLHRRLDPSPTSSSSSELRRNVSSSSSHHILDWRAPLLEHHAIPRATCLPRDLLHHLSDLLLQPPGSPSSCPDLSDRGRSTTANSRFVAVWPSSTRSAALHRQERLAPLPISRFGDSSSSPISSHSRP